MEAVVAGAVVVVEAVVVVVVDCFPWHGLAKPHPLRLVASHPLSVRW
jgi:hypothetical protein